MPGQFCNPADDSFENTSLSEKKHPPIWRFPPLRLR
jgi:hypothetical protein